jgi:Zn-finger nucleic acid-binding protein
MADTLQELSCPACDKTMKKIFVPAEGINLDICIDGCGGIFFDNREYILFDEQHENIDDILAAVKDKTFERADETEVRICPVCKVAMIKNYSSVDEQIQVDDCYKCGGKFLDNGELIKIRKEYENDKQRGEAVLQMVYNSVGPDLEKLDKEAKFVAFFANALKAVSPSRHLFDFVMRFVKL